MTLKKLNWEYSFGVRSRRFAGAGPDAARRMCEHGANEAAMVGAGTDDVNRSI
jgi:hypothetical protein